MLTKRRFSRRVAWRCAGTAAALLSAGSGGCLTVPMWRAATRTSLRCNRVVGTATDPTDGRRWVLVRYGDADESATLWAPADPAGDPAPPFAVRIWTDHFPDAPPDQQRAVVSAADAGLTHPGDAAPPGSVVTAIAVDSQAHYQVATEVRQYGRDRYVVVPAYRPADASQRPGRRWRAVLLTPLTLPADVAIAAVVVPVAVVQTVAVAAALLTVTIH